MLGLSGGGDSLALLYVLLDLQKESSFHIELAHVNHNWRVESSQEAEELERLADYLKLPFHLHIDQTSTTKDRENLARQQRLRFFRSLWNKKSYRALLLAHHANDQSETICKRFFEGASLLGLSGISEETVLESMLVYRPLLSVTKKEILSYLETKKATPFFDSTNTDRNFLRGRMRVDLFPFLEKTFGKKVQSNLVAFGNLWKKMQSYLDSTTKDFRSQLVDGPFGLYLPFLKEVSFLEILWVSLLYASKKGICPSRSFQDAFEKLVEEKPLNRRLEMGKLHLIANGKHLFLVPQPPPSFFATSRHWHFLTRDEEAFCQKQQRERWLSFWEGKVLFAPPYDTLLSPLDLPSSLRKKIYDWYRFHQVPIFLREKAPLFMKEGKLVGECLTGHSLPKSLVDRFPRLDHLTSSMQ